MAKKPSAKASKKNASETRARGGKAESSSRKGSGSGSISTPAKVLIVVFATLMTISLMLPTLSAAFNQSGSPQQAQAESSGDEGSSSNQGSGDDAGKTSPDAGYQKTIETLESRLKDDPNNLAAILNLGRNYMAWGVSVIYGVGGTADPSRGNDLLDKAIGYYERYLAINDSNAVKVDIALCRLYQGDKAAAKADLEKVVAEAPDYGPAWANLGMVQQESGDDAAAKESYDKAIAADPNNDYGAKAFAEQQLAAMNASSTSTSGTSSVTSTSNGSGARGLSETLGSRSGTSF